MRKDDVVLLLCRSGKRSALAAEAAARSGFTSAFNVLEGFEGDLEQAPGWTRWLALARAALGPGMMMSCAVEREEGSA